MSVDHAELVEVAVAANIARTLTYSVPESLSGLAVAGKRVLVPLGRGASLGYVLGPGEPVEGFSLKPVADVLDPCPLFPESMIPFFRWVADYYFYPTGLVIKEALPTGADCGAALEVCVSDNVGGAAKSGLDGPEQGVLEALEKSGAVLLSDFCGDDRKRRASVFRLLDRGLVKCGPVAVSDRFGPKTESWVLGLVPVSSASPRLKGRHRALSILSERGAMLLRDLKILVPSVGRHLADMAGAGEIVTFDKPVYRDPFGSEVTPDCGPPALMDEQKAALLKVGAALGNGFSCFLLNGVTGSGKTEVYLEAARMAVEKGLSALVLVPEIALITQTERRFRARFGEKVAVYHSGLSEGERHDQWIRAARGEVSVTVGARSAIFAPHANLGLIVVDEEHDESYKQESGLRYNARDLAVVRARFSGAVAVLGSATPSVVSLHNAQNGKSVEIALTKRVEDRPFPEVRLVDLRFNKAGKHGALLSGPLVSAITETLARKEQVLLFLNRRGYSNLALCADCGGAIRCVNCDVSLTYHKDQNSCLCHYCGYCHELSAGCPNCRSQKIQLVGVGTEKLAAAVSKLFPEARLARLDRDTTARKKALVEVLTALRKGELDIVIGTQMVAKGHDFPGITLVGVVCADLSLSFPDFRAGERTYQLVSQVMGRAGRGEKPGTVIIQTYSPDHFSIKAARTADAQGFYGTELSLRKGLGYPPFTRLAQVRIMSKELAKAEETASVIGEDARVLAANASGRIVVLGPVPAPISRLSNVYRWQMLLKGYETRSFREFLAALSGAIGRRCTSGKASAYLDVDPVSML